MQKGKGNKRCTEKTENCQAMLAVMWNGEQKEQENLREKEAEQEAEAKAGNRRSGSRRAGDIRRTERDARRTRERWEGDTCGKTGKEKKKR